MAGVEWDTMKKSLVFIRVKRGIDKRHLELAFCGQVGHPRHLLFGIGDCAHFSPLNRTFGGYIGVMLC